MNEQKWKRKKNETEAGNRRRDIILMFGKNLKKAVQRPKKKWNGRRVSK